MSHWHGKFVVPGAVDTEGCCADQPPTTAELLAGLRATRDADAAAREHAGLTGGAR